MLKIQLPDDHPGFDPAPQFASDAEIELAEQLRRRLEERYFGASATAPTSPQGSGKDHH